LKNKAASLSTNLPEHSGKLGFGPINSREEVKIFYTGSSENGHDRLRTISQYGSNRQTFSDELFQSASFKWFYQQKA
jgi:hypothetical protein